MNRSAIITGAGGGIGRAAAIELAKAGFDLLLVGRTKYSLEETKHAAGTGVIVLADVTAPEKAVRVVREAENAFGRIDLLVNNAGIAPALTVEQTSIEQWHAVIETNLSAPFYLAKAAWPSFRNQKEQGGVIVNISSMAARDPFPGFAAYGSAKAGLNLLGLSLAREGATIGVRVYTLALGAVETPLLRSLLSAEQLPSNRTLSPIEVAQMIVRCATGHAPIDSGQVLWMQKLEESSE